MPIFLFKKERNAIVSTTRFIHQANERAVFPYCVPTWRPFLQTVNEILTTSLYAQIAFVQIHLSPPFVGQKETIAAKKIPGFVLGVSNIEHEIYFQGGGTNVIGDLSSGEVNPDSVFWICSQTKMIVAVRPPFLLTPMFRN